jgi:hypothetical protein
MKMLAKEGQSVSSQDIQRADGSAVFCPVGAVLAGTYFHRDFGPDVAGVWFVR